MEILQRHDLYSSLARDQLAAIDSISRVARDATERLSGVNDVASAMLGQEKWMRELTQSYGSVGLGLTRQAEPWNGLRPNEIDQLTGQLHVGLDTVAQQAELAAFKPKYEELADVASYATGAWDELAVNPAAGYALATMATLREAIERRPFAEETIAALGSQLGDWSATGLSSDLFDQQKRQAFYLRAGLDRRLIDLEPQTFNAILGATELRWSPPSPRRDHPSADLEPGQLRKKEQPEVVDAETPDHKGEELEPTTEEQLLAMLELASEESLLEGDEELDQTAEDFRRLRHFESELRGFIADVLSRAAGPGWIKQRVPGDCLDAWKGRKKEARKDVYPLLSYADFGDWSKIIRRNDNWPHFEPYFKRRVFVEESFNRLLPLRNDIAHSRLLTHADRLVFYFETHQFLVAMKSPQIEEEDE